MARQRFIWPSLWTDATIGQLSPPARILFIGCFSNADDDGRLEGDPAYLKVTVFPHDAFNTAAVESFRAELVAKCRNIVLYEYDGREYLAFTKWSEFQKPKYPRPSKLPAPPKRSARKPAEVSEIPSGNPPPALPEDSPKVPPWVGLGWVGLDRETPAPLPEAKEQETVDPASDPHTPNRNGAGTGAGTLETLKGEVEKQLAANRADDDVPF